MIGEITNHLWQSTVFAFAVALVSLAFRKNRAEVRYWLWLSASLKFLVPFSLLIGVGIRVWDALPAGKIATHITAPYVSQTMVEITQPFPETFARMSSSHHANSWIPIAILALWAFGFFCVVLMRCRSWFRIRAAVRASAPINISATIPVRSSATLLEPGVVGFLNPVLLLPEGILKKLTPPQLEAVLAHEQCHIRRRDNLTSAFHMLVEAIFWFHPIVWWIGAKLVEERERACDESVLAHGNEPQVYAEGILNVCKSYLESPLHCVSGVTGSDLKKRIRAILADRVAGDLNFGRKIALTIAGIVALAAPVFIGVIGAPAIRAQSQPNFKFDVASIKLSKARANGGTFIMGMKDTPDGFVATNVHLLWLVQSAYGVDGPQVSGAPSWLNTEMYDVDARMDSTTADALAKLTPEEGRLARRKMLQALLADRMKLVVHSDSKEAPVFSLVIAKNGPKLQESKPSAAPPNGASGSGSEPSMSAGSEDGMLVDSFHEPISYLALWLQGQLRAPVLDKTGLTGIYDFKLKWTRDRVQSAVPPGSAANGQPPVASSDSIGPTLLEALQDQLGLKLESGKGTVEGVVIDHIEKPSGN
jgi:bla regulator protein BlaR1